MKLRRQTPPDPQQLTLQLDFFSPDAQPKAAGDQPAASPSPQPIFQPAPPELQLAPGTPSSQAPSRAKRHIRVGEHVLEYRLLRSKRRSIGFLIDEDGLRITAPRWVPLAEIESAIHEKRRWIFAKLSERRERSARRLQPHMQWRDGATLPYFGEQITLRILAAQAAGVAYSDALRELIVSLPPDASEQQLKDRVQGWLQQEARRVFAERLPVYAARLGVTYRAFALSSATTQWGSCTADGRIRLNWRLIHFALPMIDYVIAHELSHLREMNHSPRFWATVQSIFPEFEAARRVLRASGPDTLPEF
ncbi:M48 family metallopeptidase [Noviherbaspirillum autotrophicum]|uniref:Metal-dependent hydrolase n=1 Tax=Noviherbaspirillum autotrophicum TaxID=709839 RepID=A0A0C2BT87_9BURK|nr:SprT family zinc-dependent metalloprotease [Noviherbaspirillum autotrophicum]KIF81261.1 metal-dependent hydrolase [Noviherbaspirillum autotrophicum]